MVKISKEVYENIQTDIPKIDDQLSSRHGSHRLWRSLRTKYSVLLPEVMQHVKEGGKVFLGGQAIDFRPELEQLKEAILAYLIITPVEEQSNNAIQNEGKELLNQMTPHSSDNLINEKIEESKLYIRRKDSTSKQTALEKIWDSFERLKTIYGQDKIASADKLIKIVSNDSTHIEGMLSKEFSELTKIGNNYHIRHFENGKEPLESDDLREYLFFRMLTLISYCLSKIQYA